MLGHGRTESRFNDAPSLTNLRRHARQPSQAPIPPLPSLNNYHAPKFESNLPRSTPQPSIFNNNPINHNKMSTSSKTSSRSTAVKSSRRGSLQNKPGLSLEAWQQYAAKGPAPMPNRKDNPYGVYMATTSNSSNAGEAQDQGQTQNKGFRAAGYGLGIPVSVQGPNAERRSSTISNGSQTRPTSQLQARESDTSRISRFEDALDFERPVSRQLAQRPGSSFRVSRFEDAYDTSEQSISNPISSAGIQSRIPRLSTDAERNREKGILSEILFDQNGSSNIKHEGSGTIRNKYLPRDVFQTVGGNSGRQHGSEPLKNDPESRDLTVRSKSAAGIYRDEKPTDRRGSVSSESKLALYGAQARETSVVSDKASIRTTNTFGLRPEADNASVKTARAETLGRQANLPASQTNREAYYRNGTEQDSKARKSLAGVFGKGPASVRSFGTTKTSITAADLSFDKDKESATVRRAKGSWSSSQTFGDKWQSPGGRKLTKTPEPLSPKLPKVEIVGTIRDAFPVVRESIELDAQRGLMPAFQIEPKPLHERKPEGIHRDLREAVQGHRLPPSAYKRGMTPEPFLEHRADNRARKKSSASPLLTKMKSAWQLNGHQASQSADLEKIEEMLTAEEKPQPPMSSLAKMKSNLNLSRFKSHKASLADIQANARQQAGHVANDSFTYVEPSIGDVSEWTLASVSSVSDGLPAPWEEEGSQGGGKRAIRKKRSMAPGALLGKMFGGKEKKDKRDSKDRFSLKNAASQLTLRPKPNRGDSASDSASVRSGTSVRSQDRKSSFANTRRMTMGQSTDPAFITDQDDFPVIPKKRSTSPIDAISPRLPEFSFSQPSTSGLDMGVNATGNESYVSRFGYGIEQGLEADRSSSDSASGHPPGSATFAYSLHSQYSRESQADDQTDSRRPSGEDNSLDVVENDLDYLRSRMSYFQGTKEKRNSGGPLPKRSSVQGVFDLPDMMPSVQETDKESHEPTQSNLWVPHRYLELSHTAALAQPARKVSATDLAKMSTVTDDLHHLVANFASYTPNSMLTTTPARGAAMISPSESQYLESESPTPISRNSQMLGAKKSGGTMRTKISPIKISPLRLALHNNLSKRYTPDGKTPTNNRYLRGDEETIGMPSRTDFDEEELVQDDDSDIDTADRIVPETFVTEPTPRGAGGTGFAAMKRSDLPQVQTDFDRVVAKGSLVSSLASLTPVDDEAPRESFDFTGEFAQLNENGCRQSFLAELDRLRLVIDETDNDNIVDTRPLAIEKPKHTKRSSLNRDFKFGRSAPSATDERPKGMPTSGIPFMPRHSQHLPDDSLFSFTSMSSIGRVVNTGISSNFVNVFEREFAAAPKADKPRTQLHSVHKSWTDSLKSSVTRTRGSIDSIDSALQHSGSTGHRRQNSSIDSAHSAMRRIGRPGVDSDRMFKTNGLYSIAGSPSEKQPPVSANQTLGRNFKRGEVNTKPSYDIILDCKQSSSRLDSLYDHAAQNSLPIGDDSLFSTTSKNASFSLFRPRPISYISDRSDIDSSSQNASPLARKSEEMLRRSHVDEHRSQRSIATASAHRDAPVMEAMGDDSFTSIEGAHKPLPPRAARDFQAPQSRISEASQFVSPSTTAPSGRRSSDVHSVISAMLDAPVARPKRDSIGQKAAHTDVLGDARQKGWEKRETMDSLMSKYTSGSGRDSMSRWVDWQREAELEIEKSKTAWADTDTSKAVVDKEFVPPTSLEDVARLIQISRYVNTSLAEASPGKQIARRAQVPLDAFDKAMAASAASVPQTKPAALPTKFQRTDTSGTIASLSGSTTPATPSGLFSFAMTQPVRESPARLPLVDTSNVHDMSPSRRTLKKSLTRKNTKATGPMRSRVTSTASARRAKLGWGRRRDSGNAPVVPKLAGERSPSKRHSQAEDENGTLHERRRSGYKARNSQNRRSIRA